MNLIILKRKNAKIELLVNDDVDVSLITANADDLFNFKDVFEKAMTDFMSDHSAAMDQYQPMIDELKASGVVGYPVTPGKDALLYAADRKIAIQTELEILCG
jgi:hypothetical protein